MKRILSLLVILISLCLPVSSFAFCGPAPDPGADWVFPGGFCEDVLLVCATSEYTTIAEAMAAAGAWDTILVAQGTYNEAVTFSQNNITLKAFGSSENTIITQAAGTAVSFSTKYGCTLEGFTVSLSASTANTDEVIYSNNNSATVRNTVKNCNITMTNKGANTFAMTAINIDDGDFKLFNNDITITQQNNHACYAIQNTAAHTSYYLGNVLTIDQQTTANHGIYGFHHTAATSTMNCLNNIINVTSTHTTTGVGYIIYGSAVKNYVSGNIIDADTSSTGIMYGLYTGSGDTAYYTGNTVKVTTGDSDGQWASFGAGTSYANANTATGDGVMGVGGTIYEGINQINGTVSIAGIVYTFPSNNGDNTEVLKTDGSGVLDWVAN